MKTLKTLISIIYYITYDDFNLQSLLTQHPMSTFGVRVGAQRDVGS